MKRRLMMTAAAVAVMMTFVMPSAKADGFHYLSRKGAWETYVTKTDEGKPMCGMMVTGRGVVLYVKHVPGDEVFIHINKTAWNIPNGTDIPGYIAFDNSAHFPFSAKGGGWGDASSGGSLIFGIKPGTEDDFLSLMADASKMIIGFDEGTQPPLVANMSGSRDAVNVFKDCNAKLAELAAGAPQPFAKQPAPQPFGNGKPQQQPATKRDDGSV